MKHLRRIITAGILIITVCMSGCLHPTGVSIIDSKTAESTFIPSWASHCAILLVDDQKREFVTIEWRSNKYLLRTRDYEGKLISEKKIDIFNGYFLATHIYSLSPNGKCLAYLAENDRSLFSYDLDTFQKTMLIEDIVSEMTFFRGIQWISDSELLIFKKRPSYESHSTVDDSSLTRFNVKSKSLVKKIELSNPERFKISPFNNYLLLLDSVSGYRDLKLFDLRTMELIEYRKNPGFEYLRQPCWSPSENYLAYVRKDSIVVRPRNSPQEKEIKLLPKRSTCYHLDFLDENTLVYRYELDDYREEKHILRAIDINTREERIIKKDTFGHIYVADHGKKIIAEVGYY